MNIDGARVVGCPLCGDTIDRARQDRCTRCHVPVRSATFAQLIAADEALRQCQRSYDALASTWTQWGERREQLAEQLASEHPSSAERAENSATPVSTARETAVPPVSDSPAAATPPESQVAAAAAAPVPTARETEVPAGPRSPGFEPPSPPSAPGTTPRNEGPEQEAPATDPFAADVFASPSEAAVRRQRADSADSAPRESASSSPAAPLSPQPGAGRASQPRRASAQEPRPPRAQPKPRRAAAVLTAPALLGVAGASLMIAAAVVFVAIAWTTFTPLMRGLAVLVVAAAVGALAARLRAMHLPITSGAVGVVAMGFAGAGVLAFLRETGAVGAFDLPAALLAAAGAGLLLTRWRIPWVGAAAALTTVGAGVGLTAAAVANAESAGTSAIISPLWAWALTGAVTSYGLAVTHTRWPWAFARDAVRWSALGWAGVVSVVVPAWSAADEASVLDTMAGAVPLVALAALARWWPRAAVTSAVGIATLLAAAIGAAAGATGWQQVIVLAAAIAVGVVLGLRFGAITGRALAYGLVPAAAFVSIATVGYALMTALSRMIALEEMRDVEWEAGVAALIAGLAFALLRAWPRESARSIASLTDAAGVFGSLMVASGVGVLALGIADLAPADATHAALAASMTLAGALLITAAHLWTASAPRAISAWTGVALLAVAGVHGVWGLHTTELGIVWSLAIALLPLGALLARGLRRPWPATLLASVFTTAIIASLATAVGASLLVALAITVGGATLGAWLVPTLPSAQRRPATAGLVPALGWGLGCALWTAGMTLGWIADAATVPNGPAAFAALAAAVALASARRLPFRGVASWAEPLGAAVALVAVTGLLAALAAQTELARSWTTAGVGIVSALVLVALLPLWREPVARLLTRVGAVVLVTLAGIGALLRLAEASQALAPALTLALAATALLVIASRWWPGAAAGPAAFLMTMIAPACASRVGLGLTAAVALTALVTAVVLAVLTRLPRRWQAAGTLGAAPAMLAAGAGVIVVAVIAVGVSLAGEYDGVDAATAWWAVALSAASGVILDCLRRLDMGLTLARGLRLAGAVSIVLATIVAIAALVVLVDASEGARLVLAPVVAVVLTAGVVAWCSRWKDSLAATLTRRGVIAWSVAMTSALEVHIGLERAPWPWALVVVLGVAVALACGARWWPTEVIAPAVALVTLSPVAVGFAVGATGAPAACVVGLLLVVCAWAVTRLRPVAHRSVVRRSVVIGAAPAGVVLIYATVGAVAIAGWALMLHLGGPQVAAEFSGEVYQDAPSWWDLGVVAVACALALVWRSLAWFRGWMPLVVVAVVAAMLPPVGAAALLSAFAIVLVLWGRSLGAGHAVPAVASALAVLWATGSEPALSGTFAIATVVALAVARGWGAAPQVWGAVVAPFTAAAAGVFATRAAEASVLTAPVAMGLAMATVLVLIGNRPGRLRESLSGTAIVITVAAPLLAESIEMAGVTLLLAAVAWWRLRSAGLEWAMWVCAATASGGTALILVGADVQVIEAYTAAPAMFMLLIGLQWMRERPQMRSVVALSPGLALALIPSYVAIILEPDALARTVALVVATTVLALVGARLRWFAPILATAVTAVVVSVLQIVVGENLVVRLVAFAVVGALLLAISSWFERLKELR